MRFTVTCFLFAACLSVAVLGNIEDDKVRHRFSRHKRQAKRRKDGVRPSRTINYDFHDTITTSILVRADNGRECSFTDNRAESKMLYIGCGYFGGVAHEIGHALGLEHTHTRHDRDDYLIVNWTNVEEEYKEMAQKIPDLTLQAYEQQYKNMTAEENENYDVPYDYGSIMHYGSSGPNPTMIPKDKNYHRTMGSALISFTDLALVNKHYKCEELCAPKTSPKCLRGGFPNPNKCDTCVCPSGYGGQLCEKQPVGCVKTITATKDWKSVSRFINNRKGNLNYFKCTNWIKSPDGTKIEVKLAKISSEVEKEGCIIAGIEIKTNKDQRLTGYRFCSNDDVGITLESESNLVPFITYSIDSTRWLNVTLSYRFVTA